MLLEHVYINENKLDNWLDENIERRRPFRATPRKLIN